MSEPRFATFLWRRPRDTHDEWRELNIGFAPPVPVAFTYHSLVAAEEQFVASVPALVELRKVMEEHRQKLVEQIFLQPLVVPPRLAEVARLTLSNYVVAEQIPLS